MRFLGESLHGGPQTVCLLIPSCYNRQGCPNLRGTYSNMSVNALSQTFALQSEIVFG